MSTLLIQLSAKHANSATEYLYVLSDDGQSIQRSGQAAASLLPATGRTAQITAAPSFALILCGLIGAIFMA